MATISKGRRVMTLVNVFTEVRRWRASNRSSAKWLIRFLLANEYRETCACAVV